jgi:hypothetical protein
MGVMVYMTIDERNRIPRSVQPTMFALMLIVIGMAFGLNAGNAMSRSILI